MNPLTHPGPSPQRYGALYTRAQNAKWAIWSDWLHAQAYGFEGCRLPNPGSVLSERQVLERQTQIMRRFGIETKRSKGAGIPLPDDIPWALWQYITEVFIPYPSTEAPAAGLTP